MLALNCPTPYVKHRNSGLIKNLKGGRRLLCANLADPVPAGAARSCGATPVAAPGL